MRALIIFILFLFVGWAGYWIVGSIALENQLNSAFEDASEQGIDLQYSEFGVQGFPNRFDTVMRDVDLKIPAEGIEWTAPLFTTAALSYKPWHLIATWPQEQTLRIGNFSADILTSEMQASVVFEPDTSLPLNRSQLVARDLRLDFVTPTRQAFGVTPKQQIAVAEVFLATRQTPVIPDAHDLLIELKQVLLPQDVMAILDPDQNFPPRVASIKSDSALTFSAPINRNNLPDLLALDLRKAEVTWANMALALNGRLTPGIAGKAEGQLSLNIRNWRDVFQVLVNAGIAQPAWEGAFTALTLSDGNPDTLETTLVFRDGQIWLGPFPLGPSPILFAR